VASVDMKLVVPNLMSHPSEMGLPELLVEIGTRDSMQTVNKQIQKKGTADLVCVAKSSQTFTVKMRNPELFGIFLYEAWPTR